MSHPRDTYENLRAAFDTTQVVLDPPEELIAERERLGLDFRDEVWEGRYHMVPPANDEHQRISGRLHLILAPLADAKGLEYRFEAGLYDPSASPANWCVPDQVAFRPQHRSTRGVEGRAELVIEIRSPGDETFQKLPFYERVGVQEFLVIDRDTKVLRHWIRQDDHLLELDDTAVALQAVEARLWTAGDSLVIETITGTQSI